jgi:zinc protease
VIPVVLPPRSVRVPAVFENVLANGLRVAMVRKAEVPIVEIRLRFPMVAETAQEEAARDLLARTVLTGTHRHSETEIAVLLQEMGASLGAGTDDDGLVLSGSVLSARLEEFVDLVDEVVVGARFPDSPVRTERARLAQEVVLARSQPEVVAEEALRKRMFAGHPYGLGLPSPSTVHKVSARALRTLHAGLASAGTLLLVGDLRPKAAHSIVSAHPWLEPRPVPSMPPRPGLRRLPILVVHRSGSHQANIRMGCVAPPSREAEYAAFDLANFVFGGYFASRLVTNLREEKGLTYNAHSRVHHAGAGSILTVSADVRTEVTGAAFGEILSELDRITAGVPSTDELEQARRYRLGTLVIGTHTQTGLADTLDSFFVRGLDETFLRLHQQRLRAVQPADVLAASKRFLVLSGMVTVVVGDAEAIAPQLEAFGRVVVRS